MLPGEVAFGHDPFGRLCGDAFGVVCGVAGCVDASRSQAVVLRSGAGGVAAWAGGVAVLGELWVRLPVGIFPVERKYCEIMLRKMCCARFSLK
jgi:hypothetical protein